MAEVEKVLTTVYNILENMAVTGSNQEMVVTAKAQLRRAMEIMSGEKKR